jgi:hypothetical protein
LWETAEKVDFVGRDPIDAKSRGSYGPSGGFREVAEGNLLPGNGPQDFAWDFFSGLVEFGHSGPLRDAVSRAHRESDDRQHRRLPRLALASGVPMHGSRVTERRGSCCSQGASVQRRLAETLGITRKEKVRRFARQAALQHLSHGERDGRATPLNQCNGRRRCGEATFERPQTDKECASIADGANLSSRESGSICRDHGVSARNAEFPIASD